jgi:hypothetical protein
MKIGQPTGDRAFTVIIAIAASQAIVGSALTSPIKGTAVRSGSSTPASTMASGIAIDDGHAERLAKLIPN